jgi:hypothetical protein
VRGNDDLNFLKLLSDPALCDLHIEIVLQIKPEVRRGAEGLAQTKGSVSGDATSSDAIRSTRVGGTPILLASAPADNLRGIRNSSRRTSPGCGQKLFGHSFFQLMFVVSAGSVIVGYLNLHWIFRGSNNANPESIRDKKYALEEISSGNCATIVASSYFKLLKKRYFL